jgi:abortive infection bacteriophage resistance protein
LPIWIAIELWDFGLLSFAFSGLRIADQMAIANRFSVPHGNLMKSWLKSLNYVRNIIAHHGRLWNASLVQNPHLPKIGQISTFDSIVPITSTKIYSVCCILYYLSSVINPGAKWGDKLKQFLLNFPKMPHANVQHMGFPRGWEYQPFWT